MAGTARQQVYSSTGRQLYTLYAQPKGADLAADVPMESFVHVLDLGSSWAYCVDLPETFGRGSSHTAGITLDGNGKKLYVADTHARKAVVLDTRDLTGSVLAEHEPSARVIALPRTIRRDVSISLTPSPRGVSLTAGSAHVVLGQ